MGHPHLDEYETRSNFNDVCEQKKIERPISKKGQTLRVKSVNYPLYLLINIPLLNRRMEERNSLFFLESCIQFLSIPLTKRGTRLYDCRNN